MTAAETALQARHDAEAKQLFEQMLVEHPDSTVAMAGIVRTTLADGHAADALAMALEESAAHPDDPALLDALGEVRFRRGEVGEAALAYNKSSKLNPCLGRTHFDVARFLTLDGMYATAQRELERAHSLAPGDQEIERRWRFTHAVPLTAEQRLAQLHARLSDPALTDEQREGVTAAIKGIETREKGSCSLVNAVEEAKLPMLPIAAGASLTPNQMYGAGLEVQFNGKKRRLEIDTGASGILLTRAVAKAAGLIPQLEVKTYGIGDAGMRSAFVTHVDDIRIGKLEFRNCMVQVVEQRGVMDVDGLIGPDVFRDYLVTLDTPAREVRLSPLPKRPEEAETKTKTVALATSEDEDDGADETPLTYAQRAKDRYVAPEMKDWTPVFRSGHFLIFPTYIGNAPVKLFMMDTGASRGMISPEAAREVTHVSTDTYASVTGISGKVKDVLEANEVSVGFANVREPKQEMQSYDTSALTRSVGVEISGLIGFPTLRELVIAIDYRDNLVHVVYDRNKGYHNR